MKDYNDLLTLLDQFAQATELPMHLFKDQSITHSFRKNIQDYNLPMYIVSSLPQNLPPIWTSNTPEFIYFGGIYMKNFDLLLFIGPLFTAECSISQSRKILNRLGRPQQDATAFLQQLSILPHCDVRHLKNHLVFLNNLINKKTAVEIPHISFHWSSFFPSPSPVILSASDSETDPAFYFPEEVLLSIIRHGKVTELENFFNLQLNLDDNNSINDVSLIKNYMIGSNTLISRVGRSVGLDYNFVNTLAEYYLEQLTHSNSISDLNHTFHSLCLRYTKEIHAILEFKCDSQLVQKVNSYILSHLYDKLSTSIIANALNFSESYVCAEFKKATGKTLTAHIQFCKINEAKYLLEQHALSPSAISNILCFSSASYFGVVFKKETGITPGDWISHTFK